MTPTEGYDVFLSHGTPDKPWVETLAAELRALGLKPFYDLDALEPADSFPLVLSEGLAESRFLVLILSPRSDRPWVRQEWAAFMAHHGPEGKIVPVLLESTEIPALLSAIQRIDATDRDAARVAREIARLAGRPGELPEGDARRLVLGQDLLFSLAMDGDNLRVTDPTGITRTVTPPWKVDHQFWLAHHDYDRLTREPVTSDADRADLFKQATTLGSLLFDVLLDTEGKKRLEGVMIPGRPRPLITIHSANDTLLALPWELLCQNGSFLLRDARIDLARSTPGEVGVDALLREPDGFLKLVVNVSAPEGSGLDYEGESYRVTKALSEQCRFMPTELGTVADLVEMVRAEKPTAIHFSGHGAPGALAFEDDEGREDVVPIHGLLQKLRERIDGPLPPLFFLASCHGNDAGGSKAETSVASLHREGVPQVVGYDGPIVDELSTRAEVAFYRALAEGGTTRYAVRQARVALAASFGDPEARHRPRAVAEPAQESLAIPGAGHTHPFAWAQLVLYHRGPDHPLSLPAAKGVQTPEEALWRTFTGAGERRILTTGFIGRRREMHEVRRRVRRGDRVLVFQGLGGLGKSTLAFHVLPMLQRAEGEILPLWCQELEQQPNRLEGLVAQLLDFCRKRFGLDWEQVVHHVDQAAGDNSLQRLALFLQVLLQNVPRLVFYLDNLESLQIGPKEPKAESDAEAIGEWASEDLGRLWEILTALAHQEEHFYIVASCRYRNPSFGGALLLVSPLPPGALLRLMSWFPALRRLSLASRARLVGCLAGHPRAVEYADDLLAHALAEHEDRYGLWKEGADPEVEWSMLVEKALPKVRDKLQANLLLAEIWNRVLTDRERRMLYRMTLLRQPWQWPLMAMLGEDGEGDEAAFATAERLRRTSLLEQVELLKKIKGGNLARVRCFTLHPATVQLVQERFGEIEGLGRAAHRRLGDRLEAEVKTFPAIEVILEAGYHLFQAGEYDRAYSLLGSASEWLQEHGRVREGLQILEPFLAEARGAIEPECVGSLLGTLGLAHLRLSEVEKAIALSEQALAVAREIGDRRLESSALGNLGLACAGLGQLEKAIGYNEQQLVIAREIGNRRGEGKSLGNLGTAYRRLGKLEKAIEYYEQQLVIVREMGDREGQGKALWGLANVSLQMGELEKAIGHYGQALQIAREIGDRQGEGGVLGNLGTAYSKLGELERAIGYLEQHLMIAREIGHRQGEGNALGALGNAYFRLGEVAQAIEYYEQHLEIAREIGDREGEGGELVNLALAYVNLEETDKAIALLEQALAIGQAIKDPQIIRVASATLHDLRSGS